MRIGAAARELARMTGARSTSPGYDPVPHRVWSDRVSNRVLPVGAHLWYKAQDALWWLGKISKHSISPNVFFVRFLDNPGTIKINLSPKLYTTAVNAVCGLWCLQLHRRSSFKRGLLRTQSVLTSLVA